MILWTEHFAFQVFTHCVFSMNKIGAECPKNGVACPWVFTQTAVPEVSSLGGPQRAMSLSKGP